MFERLFGGSSKVLALFFLLEKMYFYSCHLQGYLSSVYHFIAATPVEHMRDHKASTHDRCNITIVVCIVKCLFFEKIVKTIFNKLNHIPKHHLAVCMSLIRAR